jgi:hypothetical protein
MAVTRTSISGSPVVDLVWLAVLLIVWATLLGSWLGGKRFAEVAGEMIHEIDIARCRFLVKLAGGSVGLALGVWGIGRLLAERPGLTLAGQPLSRLTTVTPQASFRAIPNGSATPVPAATATTIMEDRIQHGRIPVGGIAWAGNRGIQKVELRVDNGEWLEAELRTPPLSPLTWVQWRYNWPSVSGQHTFTVWATDGTGRLQIGKSQPPYPNGATGYDSVTVTI